MAWVFVRFRNGMDHCVEADLAPMILLGMSLVEDPPAWVRNARMPEDERDLRPFPDDAPVAPIVELSMDLPGIVYMDRPWEEVEFQGLKLCIPSEDLATLTRHWSKRAADDYCGIPFYRFIANDWRCLVLLPHQRGALLALLEARCDAAETRAEQFYKTRDTPQTAFRKINEAHGVPKNAEIYGDDPRERFDSNAS